jgi:ssDNA-binding replication factor A large subunit
MHKMASDIINIRKDMNGLSSQMKEITKLLKQQIEIKTSASNFIKSSPGQRRRTGNTGSGSVSSNDDTKRTCGSDCDSEMEEAVGKVDQNRVAMYTGGKSGQPSRLKATQK